MKKTILTIAACLGIVGVASAHVIPYEVERMKDSTVFWNYLRIGYEHILPLGTDHILFITCVFFLNTSLRKVVLQASMFTLAHSITLALAMYGIVKAPSSVIEPLIAFSIFLLAIENIATQKVHSWRMASVFGFGLVHGLGFASALSDLGLPSYAFAKALISFNIGVELGQLTIIILLYAFVARIFRTKIWYRPRIVIPISAVIAAIALYWTVERVL